MSEEQLEYKINTSEKKPISIEELKNLAQGEIIDIPSWNSDQTVSVRVKKIDMTKDLLVENGAFTNILKSDVIKSFDDKKSDKENFDSISQDQQILKDILPLVTQIAKESLLEPTYEEFEEIYPLTFRQKYAIMNYQMEGLRQLGKFRND